MTLNRQRLSGKNTRTAEGKTFHSSIIAFARGKPPAHHKFLIQEPPTCAGLLRYQHWYVSDESMVVFHVTDSSYAEEQQEYRRTHVDTSVVNAG